MGRILQISDLHFGDEDRRLVRALTRWTHELKPDLIVVSGDLTQAGRRREFAAAADFLKALAVPCLVAAGNHDTPMFNIPVRLFAPFERFRKRLPGIHPDVFHANAFSAAALNTARGVQARRDWSLGSVKLDDACEAIRRLPDASADKARILACHHPFVTPKNAPFPARTRRGHAAARLAAEEKIDLVLTGHMHLEFAERLPYGDQGVWSVGAGTAFSSRTRGAPASFNQIDVMPDRFDMTVYYAAGSDYAPSDPRPLRRRGA